ncbi:hypothetical protein B5S33_g5368 [[Candida] boidinii]|nr:hypothetical protein B5S33_g5368 [[Candida] boidinii]
MFKRVLKVSHLQFPQRILKNQKLRFYSNGTTNNSRNKTNISLILGVGLISGLSGYLISQKLKKNENANESAITISSTTKLSDLETPTYATPEELAQGLIEIKKLLPADSISNTESEINSHASDPIKFVPPMDNERSDIIVYPETIEQVSEIAKICHRYRIPMIPYSGGTSIEGHYIPTRRGVCIDMSKMNKILAVHEDDLDVVVQPGIGWMELNEELDQYGLMFGCDPGPGAEIGGMVATSCSGTNASRYGTMKENVISLKVVLADGTIIKTKNRPRKSSNGYNLTGLFVGSEGTLGIIVEATLKLHVKPKHEVVALMHFKQLRDATKTVSDIFKSGLLVNAVELMDEKQMTAIAETGTGGDRIFAPNHMLLFKLGGISETSVNEIIRIVDEISRQNNGFNFQVAKDDEDKEDIWRIRKTLLWNSLTWAKERMPNVQILPTDVAVPVSKLPEMIESTMVEIEGKGLLGTAAGHAGDGNVHVLVIFPPEKLDIAKQVIDNMCNKAIQLEGTISGEHGIGAGKREFLMLELGEETINTMRTIKLSLDPLRLLNPDKIFAIDPLENRSH